MNDWNHFHRKWSASKLTKILYRILDSEQGMKRICLFDLPLSAFRVNLNDHFLDEIKTRLEKKYTTHATIARQFSLKKGDQFRRYFVTKRSGIPLNLLKRISEDLAVSESVLEKNIVVLKTIKSKEKIENPHLPIHILTPEMGLVVGGVLGDGGIEKGRQRVWYFSSETEQLKMFADAAQKTFGKIRIMKHRSMSGVPCIILPKAIGVILQTIGLCAGDKNYNSRVTIPAIFQQHPTSQATKALIRRLMDDDGTVVNHHCCRRVALVSPKIAKETLECKVLKSVQCILEKNGIRSKIVLTKTIPKENGCKTQYWQLIISKKENLQKYYTTIGFGLARKQNKLKRALDRYDPNRYEFERGHAQEEYLNAVQSLLQKGILITTRNLAKATHRNSRHIREVLLNLFKTGKLNRNKLQNRFIYRTTENPMR